MYYLCSENKSADHLIFAFVFEYAVKPSFSCPFSCPFSCLIQERHQALVQMGVSVETSGIKVEHGRYFLVNLNADPSLNELLVYYLKVGIAVACNAGVGCIVAK